MTAAERDLVAAVPLSRSQQNIYNGVLQDPDPALYLIAKSYRFHPVNLRGFLAAVTATILDNPIHLCVLEAPEEGGDYPSLVPRLQVGDVVRVRSTDDNQTERGAAALGRTWAPDILAKPLVRYTVWTNESDVVGLDVHTHHILLDGGATGIIEVHLARHLEFGADTETPCCTDNLTRLRQAHRRETTMVEQSTQRLADAVRRGLAEEGRHAAYGPRSTEAAGTAAKGTLQESVRISGQAYEAIRTLAETQQVPLNVLVAAAAVAVDASRRQSTETLLVHPVDNRFGDPALDVATCLVNSVAHPVRFPVFASTKDVVRTLDRSYVLAVRRRWIREEHYRRMYLAVNRTSPVDALTLNFIRQPCAPGLRPFLSEAPVATDIGPVEGMTVACVLDEEERALTVSVWDRADLATGETIPGVATRIAAALESMPAMWDQPIAMTSMTGSASTRRACAAEIR